MTDVKTSDLVKELAVCRERQLITAELVRRAHLAGLPVAQWVADNLARQPADVVQSFKDQWSEWECQARQRDLPIDQFVHLEASSHAQILVDELVRRGCDPEVWWPFGEPPAPALHLVVDNDQNDQIED
jgi:hypothetical protein